MESKVDEYIRDNPAWFKYLVFAALFSGAGNSFVLLNKNTEAYVSREEFKKELEQRDVKISQVFDYIVNHGSEASKYKEKVNRLEKEIELLNQEVVKLNRSLAVLSTMRQRSQ